MDSNKSSIRFLMLLILTIFTLGIANAATGNVIDVAISDNVYEEVLYNPLKTGAGTFFDSNENQSLYVMNGTIVVSNNHPTEHVGNLVVRINNVSDLYNITNLSGRTSFVSVAADKSYMNISIPDLGAGQIAVIGYYINTTIVAPPINFTSSYDKSKVFAGLPLSINDKISNQLNTSKVPNTCIYNINITQNALTVVQAGGNLNFTFDNTTLAGSDASNASFTTDNRTINWNVFNGGCFNSGNSANINYSLNTPNAVATSGDYKLVNTTIAYAFNHSFTSVDYSSVTAFVDNDLNFQKRVINVLNGDNATWRVSANISNPTNITVNLTQATLWVSKRSAGSTNPSNISNDTISGAQLLRTYYPNMILNTTNNTWTTNNTEWFFNYTYSSSPIVWMNLKHNIVSDGVQITNRSVSYSNNSVYIKEIYLATGYWLQIFKNITRLANDSYQVDIKVRNLGTSSTPKDQVVVVYNFIPKEFNVTSSFVFSSSTWYNTTNANQTLNDPIYNGTMYQWGLIADTNPFNSSLDKWNGTENTNNTWSVTYNVTGSGQFKFDDLFLTGVDPLNVQEKGSTLSVVVESAYSAITSNLDYTLGGVALVVGVLLLLL